MKKWNVLILCLLSLIYMNTDTATSFSENDPSVDTYFPHAKNDGLEQSVAQTPSRYLTLKQKAKLCKKQLATAEQSLTLAQKEVDSLQETNRVLSKKKNSLKKQLVAALQDKKEYEEKYKHIEAQKDSSQAADHKKNQLIADLRKQLEINGAEMKALKAEINIAQTSCRTAFGKISKRDQRLEATKTELKTAHNEIAALQKNIQLAHNESNKVHQELSAYKAQELSREQLIISYKDECQSLTEKLKVAQLELAQTHQLSQEINRIKNDYEESRVMCARLQKKLVHVQENFTEAQNKLLASKEEIMGLNNALTLAQSQEKLAQSQLTFIQKTHDSSQHHVAELAQENKELRTTLFTVQNNLHTAQTDFNNQHFSFKAVQDQLQYALNDKQALEARITKLTNDHETACAEIITAKNSYTSLKTELELAHNKNSSLQSELEKLGTNYSSTRKDLELAHNQYGTLQKHFDTTNNEFNVIKTNLSTLQENNESLQAKLEETNNHYENLQAQLAKPARAHNKIIMKKTVA